MVLNGSSFRDIEAVLAVPPLDASALPYCLATDLAAVRHFVAAHAMAAGLPTQEVGALVLAVNELATNTVKHTGGPGLVYIWRENRQLVIQVSDNGILPPTIPAVSGPALERAGGRGLLLVSRLAPGVQIRRNPATFQIRATPAGSDSDP